VTAAKAEEKEKTVLGVVLNKIKESNEIDINSIESVLGSTVIGEIPYDNIVIKARASVLLF